MYVITQGSEVLEVTSYIEYVKLQKNGKKVTSTAADYDFIYSRDSDKMYDKNIAYVSEVDDPAGLASNDQTLGREITDLQLDQIGQGQEITELQLKQMEASANV